MTQELQEKTAATDLASLARLFLPVLVGHGGLECLRGNYAAADGVLPAARFHGADADS